MIILLFQSNIIYISLFSFLKNDNAIVLVGRGGGAVQNVQYIIRYANDLVWVTFFRVRNVCTCINNNNKRYTRALRARKRIATTIYTILYIIYTSHILYYYYMHIV